MEPLVTIANGQRAEFDLPSTLRMCRSCKGPRCCERGSPFLTNSDISAIASQTGISSDQFVEVSHDNQHSSCYRIKRNALSGCWFYDSTSGQCRIYEARPLDCRLFPLDIAFIDNKYAWIMYTSCPVELRLTRADALEMATRAEKEILPRLLSEITVYASLPNDAFGSWIVVREISAPMTE
jgi:Fe-S-cluster containining protein